MAVSCLQGPSPPRAYYATAPITCLLRYCPNHVPTTLLPQSRVYYATAPITCLLRYRRRHLLPPLLQVCVNNAQNGTGCVQLQ